MPDKLLRFVPADSPEYMRENMVTYMKMCGYRWKGEVPAFRGSYYLFAKPETKAGSSCCID